MTYNALNVPPSARDQPANEVMRAAIHDGSLHLSMRRAFDEPSAWGLLFVDAARHIASVYAHEKICTEQQAIDRIRAAFESGIRKPSENPMQTVEIKDAP